MRSFDPSKAAEVYDELNGEWFEWRPYKYERLYRECSNVHDEQRQVIEWDGLLLAGGVLFGGMDRIGPIVVLDLRRSAKPPGTATAVRAAPTRRTLGRP